MEKEKPNYDGRLGPDSAGDKCYEEVLLLVLLCMVWSAWPNELSDCFCHLQLSSPFFMIRDVETTAGEEDAIETG